MVPTPDVKRKPRPVPNRGRGFFIGGYGSIRIVSLIATPITTLVRRKLDHSKLV
jgi:hypothetical protein